MTTQATGGLYYEFTIADRIRAAREANGMDQAGLADATDLSRTTVSNYETGRTHPGKGAVRRIAWATGYDFDWLMSGKLPPTSRHNGTCVSNARNQLAA